MSKRSKYSNNLLEVKNIKHYFPITKGVIIRKNIGTVKAVDGVSFNIKPRETFGLVGESGCGKSTLAKIILRSIKSDEGNIIFDGNDVTNLKGDSLLPFRSQVSIIFQDPYSSLNPRMTVKKIVAEPLITHNLAEGGQKDKMVIDVMERVGLPKHMLDRYPHEFSGGQRQRIAIARALILKPKLVVADEPVAALDVSVQAQILNLMKELQENLDLAYLIISHDLNVVKYMANRIAVMYLGRIVELGSSDDVFYKSSHPYTKSLLSSAPIPDPSLKVNRIILQGDVPSPSKVPSGCAFHPRCYMAKEICSNKNVILNKVKTNHLSSCHFSEEV
mgnify:CR=1 FL=1|tara:strand:+ start:1194 stop:2189 length:996 start_codon:yes stop_codon:yes gene_type:complete